MGSAPHASLPVPTVKLTPACHTVEDRITARLNGRQRLVRFQRTDRLAARAVKDRESLSCQIRNHNRPRHEWRSNGSRRNGLPPPDSPPFRINRDQFAAVRLNIEKTIAENRLGGNRRFEIQLAHHVPRLDFDPSQFSVTIAEKEVALLGIDNRRGVDLPATFDFMPTFAILGIECIEGMVMGTDPNKIAAHHSATGNLVARAIGPPFADSRLEGVENPILVTDEITLTAQQDCRGNRIGTDGINRRCFFISSE